MAIPNKTASSICKVLLTNIQRSQFLLRRNIANTLKEKCFQLISGVNANNFRQFSATVFHWGWEKHYLLKLFSRHAQEIHLVEDEFETLIDSEKWLEHLKIIKATLVPSTVPPGSHFILFLKQKNKINNEL